jgi:hypothetical protein
MGYQTAETQEYAGKGIVALANDPKVLEKTGKFVTTAGLGSEYGFKDIDGREITFDHFCPRKFQSSHFRIGNL